MVVINPAPWLQNSGATNTAQLMRLASGGLVSAPVPATSSLGGRSGIAIRGGTNNYDVTQNGGGNMSVNVAPGLAYVRGTQSLTQSGYWIPNDASVNLAVAASHPTNNRTDSVYVAIQDDFYSGGTHTAILAVATGDPLFPTTPPTLPANALEIFRITVLAGTTSILTAQIADRRPFLAALSAIPIIQSFEVADSGNIAGMHRYYGIDGAGFQRWDGAAWRPGSGLVLASATGNVASPTTGQFMGHTTNLMQYRYTGSVWKPGVNIPKFSGFQGAAQSIPNNTWTAFNWDNEVFDTANAHSTVSNTSRYVIPFDGEYWCSGIVYFAGPSTTGTRNASLAKNGTIIRGKVVRTQAHPDGFGNALIVGGFVQGVTGDYIELMGIQLSGGALNTSALNPECSSLDIMYTGQL
jgi:hypothetical protein